MSDEWGPWIDHDGKGCPCKGQYVHLVNNFGAHWFGVAGLTASRSWRSGHSRTHVQIVRYRIRRPRGMAILQRLIEKLPEGVS